MLCDQTNQVILFEQERPTSGCFSMIHSHETKAVESNCTIQFVTKHVVNGPVPLNQMLIVNDDKCSYENASNVYYIFITLYANQLKNPDSSRFLMTLYLKNHVFDVSKYVNILD